MSATYPVTERNRVRRLHERGRYEHEAVHVVLDAAMVCHIAYVIDGQPYCTPTSFWREGDRLYWHGSSASRMLESQAEGLPVCLTVTHLDGLVLARSGFNCSMNYRAVMAFGTARKVADPAHKRAALDAYVNRVFPGRVAEMRAPTDQELKATLVMSMVIEEASAKIRADTCHDDPEDAVAPIWAGVVPVAQMVGALEPHPELAAAIPPSASLAGYVRGARFDAALADQTGAGRMGAGAADAADPGD